MRTFTKDGTPIQVRYRDAIAEPKEDVSGILQQARMEMRSGGLK